MTRRTWAAGVAALVVALGLFYLLSPSREDRIRDQLAVLAENISKAPGQNQLITAANAKRLRAVITEALIIDAPAEGYRRELDAAEIPALVLSATSPYSELTLSFHDPAFRFPSEGTARVTVSSRARGRLTGGEWIEDVQELNCRFRLVDDAWRLAAVEVVEVLQK